MSHLPILIVDLALILGAASVAGILCRWIRLPVALGYLIVGILVGPSFSWLPTVREVDSIQVWAEMGVIFLLFGMGLEFSFKKLIRVGPSATLTAFVELPMMMLAGYFTGRLLGWKIVDCLFLGGMLCISSTAILSRVFEDLGLKGRKFTQQVYGLLVLEDLAAVLILVLLSTVAVTRGVEGSALLGVIIKLAFFVTLWFLVGIFFIPTVLRRLSRFFTEDLLLIFALALCLLMVLVAVQSGFSPALGAFVMGSIVAETQLGPRVEKIIHPIKSLFGAVFFVSVGMLMNPKVLVDHGGAVAIISAVVIFGKFFSVFIGSLLSGLSLRHSIQTGLSMTQIGEFSFIMASLGVTLSVTSTHLYPIAVAVSIITCFITPLLLKGSTLILKSAEKLLPIRTKSALETYHTLTEQSESDIRWKNLFKLLLTTMLIHTVMVVAIGSLTSQFLLKPLVEATGQVALASLLGFFISVVLSSPFLWALSFGNFKNTEVRSLWMQNVDRRPQLAVILILRVLLAIGLFLFFLVRFYQFYVGFGLGLALLLPATWYFSRHLESVYLWLSRRFKENFDDRERSHFEKVPRLAPWDAHMARFTVSLHSSLAGQSLEKAAIRERMGVTVAMIERGPLQLRAPGKDHVLFPQDVLYVIGTDEQMGRFGELAEASGKLIENAVDSQSEYGLFPVRLSKGSEFLGKPIRTSGLREKVAGLVVGIERAGKRHLNPDSGMILEAEDLLWVVGDRKKIETL